ncbi:MAG TPA: MupG family TIM beta-alpha barrel fold protein [Negativicutes bacterium]|nr:MupG family TIM beta-alpha barrel fold protein [Negativicutes bacterium]
MKKLGVSVFTGMEQSVEENIKYLKLAESFGFSKLFTSLHIPEANYRSFLSDCRNVLDAARNLGFEVTADVSPRSWEMLGIKPAALRSWGLHTLRADFGFSPEKLLQLADDTQLHIEVNASSMTENELTELLLTDIDRSQLCAGHNYYPRCDTGLSFELFFRRSQCFKAVEIPVSAFIPCLQHPRGPMFAGLPTIEAHRRMNVVESVRQFWASGMVDAVLFGDPLASAQEMEAVAALPREIPDPLVCRVAAGELTQGEGTVLWASKHTNRVDAAGDVIRSQESRGMCNLEILPQTHPQLRRRGSITIDNAQYGRYAGELQITLQDLPADERVNVVGRIIDEDLCLLTCIAPGRKFCLKEV